MCYNYLRKMVNKVDGVEIGNLTILYKDKWEAFKLKRAKLYDELEYAMVKELDENRVLIDESRLHKILKVYNLGNL